MITQGKHAKIKLYETQVRVFKTYKDPVYVDNEFFALNFLAQMGIMDLNPKKESLHTISMDWIRETVTPELVDYNHRSDLVKALVSYLKNLHEQSFKEYGKYITHEDVFLDNILICKKEGTLYFIDWGLSKKRDSVLPDFASIAMGIFNEYPESFRMFVNEYFGECNHIDIEELDKYIFELYEEYKDIRLSNNFETGTLNERLNRARIIIKLL